MYVLTAKQQLQNLIAMDERNLEYAKSTANIATLERITVLCAERYLSALDIKDCKEERRRTLANLQASVMELRRMRVLR